jgi:hypothetical protein
VNFIGVSSFCLSGLYLLREPATDQHFIAGARSKEKGRIKIRLFGAMRCPGSDAGRGALVVPAARAGRAASSSALSKDAGARPMANIPSATGLCPNDSLMLAGAGNELGPAHHVAPQKIGTFATGGSFP